MLQNVLPTTMSAVQNEEKEKQEQIQIKKRH